MLCQPMLGQLMIRRLALRSPYSKPSIATAEDSLPHPASRCRFASLDSASIAAVNALCNAAVGLRTAGRLTLGVFTIGTFKRRNHAPDVAPVRATLTANRLQKQQRKQISFKETARAGAIRFVCATSPAVEFLEKPAPRGSGKGSHDVPPGQNHSNPE